MQVGTVTTGEPGSAAQVTNSGTNRDAVLNFVIPKGDTGTGAQSPEIMNAYSTPSAPVTSGNALIFDRNAVTYGTAISHTPDTAPFTISQPGFYDVSFNGSLGSAFPLELLLYLEQNGTVVPGATASQTFQSDTASINISFSEVIQVTSTPTVLRIVAQGANFLYSDVSLTIYRIGTAS